MLPNVKFFEPRLKFVNWMMRNYSDTTIFDVGAGVGHVSAKLRSNGLKVIPIDLVPRESPECEVYMLDATEMRYPKDCVVLLARPCHGHFVEGVIRQAFYWKVSAFLYVGLDKNVENDLGYDHQFKCVAKNVGRAGENLWIVKNIASSK